MHVCFFNDAPVSLFQNVLIVEVGDLYSDFNQLFICVVCVTQLDLWSKPFLLICIGNSDELCLRALVCF